MEPTLRFKILELLHIEAQEFSFLDQLIAACIILLIIALIDKLTKIILNKVVSRMVRASKITWDDVLLDKNVISRTAALLPAILLMIALPFVFIAHDTLYSLTSRLCWIYLIGNILSLVVSLLSAASNILEQNEAFKNKPVKGFTQMLQVIFIIVGIIIMISVVVDKSPVYLLTGIGASAAVLMLIFQDLILGLVAGIQLSANKMMQVGDWVEIKDKNIDGTVLEITLTTVKIRNWDYTISTIQPQALVNGSFTNWSNMFSSGGRRIKRAINIDLRTVRFMSAAELEKWSENALLRDYINDTLRNIDNAIAYGDNVAAESMRITNLTLFRIYMHKFISQHPSCAKNFLAMTRLLAPTAQGVPLEIYYFSNNTAWVNYEAIQASLFEYVYAIIPEFSLKIFQSPSGDDIRAMMTPVDAKQ